MFPSIIINPRQETLLSTQVIKGPKAIKTIKGTKAIKTVKVIKVILVVELVDLTLTVFSLDKLKPLKCHVYVNVAFDCFPGTRLLKHGNCRQAGYIHKNIKGK